MASSNRVGSGAGESFGDRSVYVIQNPAAGTGSARWLTRRIRGALAERAIPHTFRYTRRAGHAEELARSALDEGWPRILVAGGDGTVLEVVSALAGTDSALALLPVGTGNQLAANLGIPRRLSKAITVAVDGDVRRIDVGVIDGQPFTCMAGAGLDAEIVRPGRRAKRWVGYLAYLGSALWAALSPPRASLRITIDDRDVECRGVGVEVANMPGIWGPGLREPVRVVPDGALDDGRLEVCVLAFERTSDLVGALISILAGHPERDSRLRYYRGRTIVVDSDPPLSVQVDGESFGTTPFRAEVRPQALKVVVPRGQDAERET